MAAIACGCRMMTLSTIFLANSNDCSKPKRFSVLPSRTMECAKCWNAWHALSSAGVRAAPLREPEATQSPSTAEVRFSSYTNDQQKKCTCHHLHYIRVRKSGMRWERIAKYTMGLCTHELPECNIAKELPWFVKTLPQNGHCSGFLFSSRQPHCEGLDGRAGSPQTKNEQRFHTEPALTEGVNPIVSQNMGCKQAPHWKHTHTHIHVHIYTHRHRDTTHHIAIRI